MPSPSQRESLPFEPKSNKRQGEQANSSSSASSSSKASSEVKASPKKPKPGSKKADAGIPEVVSRRMIRRMAVFAGVPTALGMSSFVIAYVLLSRHIVEFPNVLVLLVSLGFFGLGTVGLSYGVLSASWQEDLEGSLLGISEFSVNFRRLVQGLRKKPSASDDAS
ncbi:PAM68 family protein [Leptolyngbya sp. Heron Island J]|uniref:PAM68 family protein n=1 Tax=Leptolyngbya sp. Heron Island J TaxID=1385935 RepID=UPI0004CFB339|nr:PAM68 family protein [Leptolyngbya sp. Heron Island J]